MSVAEIADLAKDLAQSIVGNMKKDVLPKYKLNLGQDEKISGYPEDILSHTGIYGFSIEKEKTTAIAYIGKAEGGARLRQHLTANNIDGTPLKSSVKNKNKNIKNAIRDGYIVHVCLYADEAFEKSSLSCVEIATSLYAREDCSKLFRKFKHWNERIG